MSLVERLLVLGRREDTVLARRGTLSVHESEGLRWLYAGGRSIQSVLRLDAPAQPVLPALAQLLTLLLLHGAPRTVLSLGLGGGGCERFLAEYRPGCRVLSVESSADVLTLAREFMFVDGSADVILDTADRALARAGWKFDLIFCDLFVGEDSAPCLTEASFHARLDAALAPDGALAINLSPPTEADLLSVLLVLRRRFPWVMLAKVAESGNVVLLASRFPPPAAEVLRQRALALSEPCAQDFVSLLGQFALLPPRTA